MARISLNFFPRPIDGIDASFPLSQVIMDITGVFITCRISSFIMNPGASGSIGGSGGSLGDFPGMGGA